MPLTNFFFEQFDNKTGAIVPNSRIAIPFGNMINEVIFPTPHIRTPFTVNTDIHKICFNPYPYNRKRLIVVFNGNEISFDESTQPHRTITINLP